jgi:hypothetical protein
MPNKPSGGQTKPTTGQSRKKQKSFGSLSLRGMQRSACKGIRDALDGPARTRSSASAQEETGGAFPVDNGWLKAPKIGLSAGRDPRLVSGGLLYTL